MGTCRGGGRLRTTRWATGFVRSIVFGFALLPWSSRANADTRESRPIPITWDAPAGCPSLDDVRGYLDAVVPEEVRSRLDDVRSSVVLTESEGGYRGEIRVAREGFVGERSVEGRRCDDVARSAIIVISVALTEAVNAEPAPPPDPEPQPLVDEPAPSSLAADVEVAERPSRIGIGGDLSIVSGIASSTVAPRVSVFVRLELSDVVALGLRLRAVPYARVGDDERLGRVAMTGVVPDVCALARVGAKVRVGGCALVEVAAVVARGTGVEQARRAVAGMVAVGVEPTLEVGDRVRFRVALEAEARLVRPRYVVSGDGTVERTSLLAAGARLGLLVRIP